MSESGRRAARASRGHERAQRQSDPIVVEVSTLTHDGHAIGRQVAGTGAGRVVFVDGAAPGERVTARVSLERSTYARAELLSIERAGPSRIEPPCRLARECGGCSWQHVDVAEQRRVKRALVEHDVARVLARLGHPSVPIGPIADVSSEGWRLRARLRLRLSNGRVWVGYFRRGSHRMIDVEHCLVLAPELQPALTWLREALLPSAVPGIEAAGTAVVAQDLGGGWAASIQLGLKSAPVPLVARLSADSRAMGGIVHTELGRASWGSPTYRVLLGEPGSEVEIPYPAGGFSQAHGEVTRSIVSRVVDEAGTGDVLDLFCGAGTFTLPLAARGVHVRGVDVDVSAVDTLNRTAAARSWPAMAVASDLFDAEVAKQETRKARMVLLDPPREGALAVCQALPSSPCERISYVSCHPATWLRDLVPLLEGGFRLVEVGLYDMFPHTPHLEIFSVFER